MTLLEALVAERTGREWCLLLDRDGVLNRRIVGGYVTSPAELELLPGVPEALGVLTKWAPHVVVVSNQQGVGRGVMTPADLEDVHTALRERAGVDFDAILVCPHRVEDRCGCRKPLAGLARDWLAERPAIDGSLAVMVGDAPTDREMASHLAATTGGCVAIGIGADAGADLEFRDLPAFADAVADALRVAEGIRR